MSLAHKLSLSLSLSLGGDFTKLFLPSKKLPAHRDWQRICSSISSTIKTPNLKLKLAHFLPNTVRQKSQVYDEIDPWSHSHDTFSLSLSFSYMPQRYINKIESAIDI